MEIGMVPPFFPDGGQDIWQHHPGNGLQYSRDGATGLRRYVLGGRRYDEVVEGLFLGPEHWDYSGLRSIARAILDLRRMTPEEREVACGKATAAGLKYGNFGFEDGCLPPDELLRESLEWLEAHHGTGISCLVHCAAGISRSPFVVGLYLLPRFGWDLERTMGHLLSRRREILPAKIYLDYLRRRVSEKGGAKLPLHPE